MKFQRFIVVIILIFGYNSALIAQDYSVSKKSERINNTQYEGYSIIIKGPLDKVTNQIYSYLKGKSKIRRKRNYYTIAEFNMEKIQLDSAFVYLKLSDKESGSKVWVALNTSNLEESRIEEINQALQEELVPMARSYYVYEQELKIKEAETAAQVISKKQQSLIDENLSLKTGLQRAEDRKIELTNLLEENRLTIAALRQKLIDNKFEQDSTYLDLQKVNRVIEGQKQKLKEID
jgi:hypothetical protein